MKITVATRHDLYPLVHGAAVKIVRTADALSRLGCDVTVVTGDRLHYHRYVNGEHELIPYPPRFVAATRRSEGFKSLMRRIGLPDYWRTVEHLLLSLGYPDDEHILYQPIVDPDFWLRTLYVGKQHGSEWFQAEFPGFLAPCWVAARLLGKRCSVVQHNVEWSRLADTTDLNQETIQRLREIEMQLCHLADEGITCSRDDRALMLNDDFDAEDITVIPHGVDIESYGDKTGAGIREHYGVPRDHSLLFFHGTLHYYPNTVACRMLAQEILPRLRDKGRKVKALVAGLSPPHGYAHPDLIYAGCVDDLVTHVTAADLCVVPLLDGGGTRLKILEYFAASKAVVSTRKGAEGLYVRDRREIHRVEDGDWDEFVARIEQCLDSPQEALGMGTLGRHFVEQYRWLDVGGAYLELYEGRELVRGLDYNEAFRDEIYWDDRPLKEIGAQRLAEAQEALRAIHRKERHGNASAILSAYEKVQPEKSAADGPADPQVPSNGASNGASRGLPIVPTGPEIIHWADDEVVYEVEEKALAEHIPIDIDWQKPRTMILLLNKRCNLKCDFCDLWHYTDMMPFESAATIIQRAPHAGVRTLVITGGEPFVHPRIYELIEMAKNLGMGVNITTNGTLLLKDLPRLKRSRVDSLSVSLDGLEDNHDTLRGVDGTYAGVMDALDVLQADTDIHLNIYFVVTNRNVRDLSQVYDMTVERGIGFDFWPVNGYPHLFVTADEDQEVYSQALEHIAKTNTAVRDRLDYYRYGVEYMGGRRDHFRCLGLIEQFGVNHEGKLVPCCVWDQKSLQVGNALEEPLDQLFFSDRAQKMREQIFEEGCVDQCFNHSLYEFQAATGLPFVVKPAEAPLDRDHALLKESGQARGEQAKARRRAAAKERRARELAGSGEVVAGGANGTGKKPASGNGRPAKATGGNGAARKTSKRNGVAKKASRGNGVAKKTSGGTRAAKKVAKKNGVSKKLSKGNKAALSTGRASGSGGKSPVATAGVDAQAADKR